MLTDTKLRSLKPKASPFRVADANGLCVHRSAPLGIQGLALPLFREGKRPIHRKPIERTSEQDRSCVHCGLQLKGSMNDTRKHTTHADRKPPSAEIMVRSHLSRLSVCRGILK